MNNHPSKPDKRKDTPLERTWSDEQLLEEALRRQWRREAGLPLTVEKPARQQSESLPSMKRRQTEAECEVDADRILAALVEAEGPGTYNRERILTAIRRTRGLKPKKND